MEVQIKFSWCLTFLWNKPINIIINRIKQKIAGLNNEKVVLNLRSSFYNMQLLIHCFRNLRVKYFYEVLYYYVVI